MALGWCCRQPTTSHTGCELTSSLTASDEPANRINEAPTDRLQQDSISVPMATCDCRSCCMTPCLVEVEVYANRQQRLSRLTPLGVHIVCKSCDAAPFRQPQPLEQLDAIEGAIPTQHLKCECALRAVRNRTSTRSFAEATQPVPTSPNLATCPLPPSPAVTSLCVFHFDSTSTDPPAEGAARVSQPASAGQCDSTMVSPVDPFTRGESRITPCRCLVCSVRTHRDGGGCDTGCSCLASWIFRTESAQPLSVDIEELLYRLWGSAAEPELSEVDLCAFPLLAFGQSDVIPHKTVALPQEALQWLQKDGVFFPAGLVDSDSDTDNDDSDYSLGDESTAATDDERSNPPSSRAGMHEEGTSPRLSRHDPIATSREYSRPVAAAENILSSDTTLRNCREPNAASVVRLLSVRREEERLRRRRIFADLAATVKKYIQELGGNVVPRLVYGTPKDAKWIMNGKVNCNDTREIFLLLKSSIWIAHNLASLYDNCRPLPPSLARSLGSNSSAPSASPGSPTDWSATEVYDAQQRYRASVNALSSASAVLSTSTYNSGSPFKHWGLNLCSLCGAVTTKSCLEPCPSDTVPLSAGPTTGRGDDPCETLQSDSAIVLPLNARTTSHLRYAKRPTPTFFALTLQQFDPKLDALDFRVFVSGCRVVRICQRDASRRLPWLLQDRGLRYRVVEAITSQIPPLAQCIRRLPRFVVDLYVDPKPDFSSTSPNTDGQSRDELFTPRIKIIKLAPWGNPTDPLLFSWHELWHIACTESFSAMADPLVASCQSHGMLRLVHTEQEGRRPPEDMQSVPQELIELVTWPLQTTGGSDANQPSVDDLVQRLQTLRGGDESLPA
eukprot:GHVT01004246.1.p1 GENE.GHVT01004246.1~~GHVT01004246.1.p1  ORF type:complete len:920 (+),score=64.38 GHVT01004246.1:236-2761(+)